MVGYTSADDPKRIEEDGIPDAPALSLRCPQVLPDTMSGVVDLLEFCLCRGCQVLEY